METKFILQRLFTNGSWQDWCEYDSLDIAMEHKRKNQSSDGIGQWRIKKVISEIL